MRVPSSAAGKTARCPKCAAAVRVPSRSGARDDVGQAQADQTAEKPRALRCPQCAAKLKVPARASGRALKCPKCQSRFKVPAQRTPVEAPTKVDADDILGIAPLEPPSEEARRPSTILEPATATGSRTCPSCAKTLPGDAKVCVDCGIYLATGRSIIITQDENLDQIYVFAERTVRLLSWLIWIGVYPIASEAFGLRKPWAVRSIALLTVAVSFAYFVCSCAELPAERTFEGMMLWAGDPDKVDELLDKVGDEFGLDEIDDPELHEALEDLAESALAGYLATVREFHPVQLLTHALLHADLLHLAGNLLFLMVLGARVNALVGNLWTAILYPLLAVIAAFAQMIALADGPPAATLGASGAVMGLAGMYLVLFPVHKVHMVAWVRWGLLVGFRLSSSFFAVRGFWVVLFYIAFDVVFTILRIEDNTARWAHMGGFAGGAVLALLLLLTRRVDARGGDILSAVLGRHAWKLIGRPGGR
jgi:membrane associated rhomboid family serine protease